VRYPYLRRCDRRDSCRYLYSHNLGVYEQHMNSSCELHVASFLIVKSRQVEGEFMKMKVEFDRLEKTLDKNQRGKARS
jgi:hypothetical protein